MGLSPRLRGNRYICRVSLSSDRSIPAPAGEPYTQTRTPTRYTVYPRACGGTQNRLIDIRCQSGLSPRLRGNPTGQSLTTPTRRSIPAPAGEPYYRSGQQWAIRVYPRACGGTRVTKVFVGALLGLSPRLRGNHARLVLLYTRERSIPAPAGEPYDGVPSSGWCSVYPRACGGTTAPRPTG